MNAYSYNLQVFHGFSSTLSDIGKYLINQQSFQNPFSYSIILCIIIRLSIKNEYTSEKFQCSGGVFSISQVCFMWNAIYLPEDYCRSLKLVRLTTKQLISRPQWLQYKGLKLQSATGKGGCLWPRTKLKPSRKKIIKNIEQVMTHPSEELQHLL